MGTYYSKEQGKRIGKGCEDYEQASHQFTDAQKDQLLSRASAILAKCESGNQGSKHHS